MATINGTHVNFVKVPTMAKFNDITTKVDGTVYFIVDEKKIHLDGVMYGFNSNDIDLTPFLKLDGSTSMTGHLDMNEKSIFNADSMYISGTNNNAGVFFENADDDSKVIILISDDVLDNDQMEAKFSRHGLQFYSTWGNEITIKGLSAVDPNDTDFENINSNHALATGTLQNFKGVAGGFAELDETGLVPSSQLPSYVDDIVEVNNYGSIPATGEKGKLYITLDNNKLYRWSGSAWVNVSDGDAKLILGTTVDTAYNGKDGLTAFNHSKVTSGNPHGVTKANVSLGSVENYGIASDTEAKLGTANNKYMTPLRTKEAVEELAPRLAWTVVA